MDYIKQLQDGKFLDSITESLSNQAADVLEILARPTEYLAIDLSEEQIDEADRAGSLSGLHKDLKKAVVSRIGGGKDSEVEDSGKIKSASALRKHINTALANGHVPVLHKDGKPIGAIVTNDDASYGRESFTVHGGEAQQKYKETVYPKSTSYGRGAERRWHTPAPYQVEKGNYNKGDAISALHSKVSDEDFKNHEITVKHIKKDTKRFALRNDRKANRPETQYVKTGKPSNWGDFESKSVVSGNLNDVKKSAALKLADQKVPQGDNKATKLHNELGQHIQSGNRKGAEEALMALHAHLNTHGLSTREHKVKEYAKELGKLKGYSKEYAKSNLARLRTESEVTAWEELLGMLTVEDFEITGEVAEYIQESLSELI